MPLYFVNVKTREGTIRDSDGTDLPDKSSGREHARRVARELMQHREPKTRFWRMDVRDSEGRLCRDLLFASVDDSICHLTPELRGSLEDLCAGSASLAEAIGAVRLILTRVRGAIARSEGAPYVAAINGMMTVDNKTADMGSAAWSEMASSRIAISL